MSKLQCPVCGRQNNRRGRRFTDLSHVRMHIYGCHDDQHKNYRDGKGFEQLVEPEPKDSNNKTRDNASLTEYADEYSNQDIRVNLMVAKLCIQNYLADVVQPHEQVEKSMKHVELALEEVWPNE